MTVCVVRTRFSIHAARPSPIEYASICALHARRDAEDDFILSNLEQTASSVAFDGPQRDDNSALPSRKAPFEFSRRGLQLLSWLAPVVLLIVWEALAQAGWLTPHILPAPSKVIRTAFKLTTNGSLLTDQIGRAHV